MLQIVIQGRGGQGAQTAGNILAKAFFQEGKHVQSYASYGGARRGAPVSCFLRVDDKPIRLRCDIEYPDAILCFDASLLNEKLLAGATKQTTIIVNSKKSVADFKYLGDFRIYPIDGISIAQKNGLKRFVNSSLLGAFNFVLQSPSLEVLKQTLNEQAPVKQEENVKSCVDGYHLAEKTIVR